jgi:hypothetical protein
MQPGSHRGMLDILRGKPLAGRVLGLPCLGQGLSAEALIALLSQQPKKRKS